MRHFILFLLFQSVVFSQNFFENSNEKTRKLALNYKDKEDLPGLSISVSYNDTIVFSEGFGFADLENKITVIPSKTMFDIGSIAKTITIASLAKLFEMDSINFEESVYKYLPKLAHKQYDFTLKQLGAHLSGLDKDSRSELWSEDADVTKDNFYETFIFEKQLYKPQEKYCYSNLGYKILGLVVELKSNLDIAKTNGFFVLNKLKMFNTKKDSLGLMEENLSKLYTFKRKDYVPFKGISCEFTYAEGCYLSTSEDLIRLGNGFLFADRLLKKETLIQLITSQKTIDGKKTNYGIGFMSQKDKNNNYYYGHAGNWVGSRAYMYIYPNSKLVVTLVANRMMNSIKYNHIDIVPEIAKNYIDVIKLKYNKI